MTNRSASTSTLGEVVHLAYRPDINGLRAVAVLAVLVFHAFPSLLTGGFVGVDVFFVISGFLITNIIVHNLANDSFSFTDFYVRRIRRIFPALLVVLLACLASGWFTLVAVEFAQLGKHIAAGAGFVSNLILWSESGYFDTDSSTKPLLHLWSLGIEEQFYLVWPLLLYLAWRKKFRLQTATLLILLASFVMNLLASGTDSAAAYYSPLGRFWELLIGALLAFRSGTATRPLCPLPYANVYAWLGFMMVVASMFIVDKGDAFPGWWAVPPVAGTALLIGAGSGAWLNRRVLSHRSLVWVGLISYPLYLWHWPLLSFAEIVAGTTPAPAYRALCLLIALLLAWLTYALIERPYRARSYSLWQPLMLCVCMACLAALGLNVMSRDGLSFRHEQLSANKPVHAKSAGFTSLGVGIQRGGSDQSCVALDKFTSKKLDSFCHLTGSMPITAVIGDSHANHLLYGLQSSANVRLQQALVIGAGGCHPITGQSPDCDARSHANLEMIQRFGSIQWVVLSANASWIEAQASTRYDALVEGYLRTALQLQQAGKTVVFVVDTPNFAESPAACAHNPLPIRNLFKSVNSQCETLPLAATLPRDWYRGFVSDLSKRNPGIRFVDAYGLFCNASTCQVLDDGTLIFKDSNHLTDYGSKLVAATLATALQ